MINKKKGEPKEECYDYMKANKDSINNVIRTTKLTTGMSILDVLQDAVFRTNKIVIHTYNFLKLYILYLYDHGKPLPTIDTHFIKTVMKIVSVRQHNAGRLPNEDTMNLIGTLTRFYNKCYKITLDENDIVNDDKLSQILAYEAIGIVTAINTNIKEHYIDHVYRFINIKFDLKTRIAKINKMKISKDEKKTRRQTVYQEFRCIKYDILNVTKNPVLTSDESYHPWIEKYKYYIIPNKKFQKDSVHYDVCCAPQDYIHGLIFINRTMEELGTDDNQHKLFNVLPLRTRIIPNYVTFDTSCIIDLLIETDLKKYSKITAVQKEVWKKFFFTKKRVFKKTNYHFNYMIKTDGFACSILFVKIGDDDRPIKVTKAKIKQMNTIRDAKDQVYIEDQPNVKKLLDNKNYVVIDPGLSDLIFCMDKDNNRYRYTQNQRRFETKNKEYMKVIEAINAKTLIDGKLIEAINVKNRIDGKSVTEIQSISSRNSKTCYFNNFLEYLGVKNKVNYYLMKQYQKKIYRRLKWYRFINTQRSENNMVKDFRSTFGEPANTVVIMGDYDNGGHHMKGKEPCVTKRLRKLLRLAKYNVYLINEFRTSKLCNKCFHETENFLERESHKPKDKRAIKTVWGILCCTNSKCKPETEPKKQINEYGSCVYNRDTNAVINMRTIVESLIKCGKRPAKFTRPFLD